MMMGVAYLQKLQWTSINISITDGIVIFVFLYDILDLLLSEYSCKLRNII